MQDFYTTHLYYFNPPLHICVKSVNYISLKNILAHSLIFLLLIFNIFNFRWIQMARKIMSKGSSSNSNGTSSKHHHKHQQQQRFHTRGSSISESNLSGLCNNNGTHRGHKNRPAETGISLNPDTGRHSPDGVTVYKTKVLYHSRADFRSAGLTTHNSAPTFYGDKEGAI